MQQRHVDEIFEKEPVGSKIRFEVCLRNWQSEQRIKIYHKQLRNLRQLNLIMLLMLKEKNVNKIHCQT